MKHSLPLLQFSVPSLALCTVILPLFAFFSCIHLSITYNFESSTATHCHVDNYLPSISSSIGEFIPQRYIWRTAIALHSAPRFLFCALYYKYLRKILPMSKPWPILRNLSSLMSVIEVSSLLGLSFVSSRENYDLHKLFFILFIACSEIYMLLMCALLMTVEKVGKPHERKALYFKKKLFVINIVSFFSSLYFFHRHNTYCEAYMYTGFAFFEYLVVLSNMAFHMTSYFDFHEMVLTIGDVPS